MLDEHVASLDSQQPECSVEQRREFLPLYFLLIPLAKREFVHRVLMGEQEGRVRQITALGGRTHRNSQAIHRLRKDFDQPLRIDDLAHDLGMSVSGFRHHFKPVTAMSPLQFQKQLRLQEARRLIFDERVDAASAGSQVGYGDAAYVNREYKRMFGESPMRDVERLREVAWANVGV